MKPKENEHPAIAEAYTAMASSLYHSTLAVVQKPGTDEEKTRLILLSIQTVMGGSLTEMARRAFGEAFEMASTASGAGATVLAHEPDEGSMTL